MPDMTEPEGLNLDSIDYWRDRAGDFQQKYEDLKEEYRSLEATGKEVEGELEDLIRMLEQQNSKLKTDHSQTTSDLEKLRQRYSELQKENNDLITTRDEQEAKLRELCSRVRDLENENDALLQSERRANYRIELLQDELESHLLKLCSLEEEVIQKDQLSEALQRMKDEARDMEQEIKVQKLKAAAATAVTDTASSPVTNGFVPTFQTQNPEELLAGSLNNNSLLSTTTTSAVSGSTPTVPVVSNLSANQNQFPSRSSNTSNSALPTNGIIYSSYSERGDYMQQQPPTAKVHPIKKSINQQSHTSQQMHHMAMRSSSRSQALQIVSDLLRKVSNVESKLASCRTYSATSQVLLNGAPTVTTAPNSTPGDAQRDAVSELVQSTEAASFNEQFRYY